jgi:hypothetical protein
VSELVLRNLTKRLKDRRIFTNLNERRAAIAPFSASDLADAVANKSRCKNKLRKTKMTRNFKIIVLGVFATLSLLAAAPQDERNKETFVTLTAPVEIEGVVLQAGSYLFKLVTEDPQLEADDVDDSVVESDEAEDSPGEVVVVPTPASDDDGDSAPQDDETGPTAPDEDDCAPAN